MIMEPQKSGNFHGLEQRSYKQEGRCKETAGQFRVCCQGRVECSVPFNCLPRKGREIMLSTFLKVTANELVGFFSTSVF